VILRRAQLDDLEAVAAVLAAAFASYRPLYTAEGYARTTPSARELALRFGEGPVWVAVIGDAIIGTLSAAADGETLHLRSMAVLPGARGEGIGRQMLDEAEAFAHASGLRSITLKTTPFLDRAIALYESYGFRRSGEDDLSGTPLWTMKKPLTPSAAA
jgi:ribosomal protein S18 acetylase RimI-like enzyme